MKKEQAELVVNMLGNEKPLPRRGSLEAINRREMILDNRALVEAQLKELKVPPSIM